MEDTGEVLLAVESTILCNLLYCGGQVRQHILRTDYSGIDEVVDRANVETACEEGSVIGGA